MRVLCHPDYDAGLLVTDAKGQVRKVLKELLPDRAETYSLVKTVFTNLENDKTNLAVLRDNEQYGTLKGTRLDEFRIPPKGKNGVFRAYCKVFKAEKLKLLWKDKECIKELAGTEEVVIIFSAEVKKSFKKEADKEKINQAERLLNEIELSIDKAEKKEKRK